MIRDKRLFNKIIKDNPNDRAKSRQFRKHNFYKLGEIKKLGLSLIDETDKIELVTGGLNNSVYFFTCLKKDI